MSQGSFHWNQDPSRVPVQCPNCGAAAPLCDGRCKHCHWGEGEKHFCPLGVKLKDWREGLRSQWKPEKKRRGKRG